MPTTIDQFVLPISDVRAFGAKGDGTTDDTASVQEALGRGGTVLIPEGHTFIVEGLTTTERVYVTGGGTLKMKPSSILDHVLRLEGDHSLVSHITIDGNASNVSAGRGEGLRFEADYCRAVGVVSRDTYHTEGASNTFYVNGDACVLEDCTSLNAGYAGVRIDGNRCRIENFTGIDWQEKGIVLNQDVDQLIVDGAYLESDTTETDSTALLLDPGTGSRLGRAVLRDIRITDVGEARPWKLDLIDEVLIENMWADKNTRDATVLDVTRLQIRNSRFGNGINCNAPGGGTTMELLSIEDTDFGSSGTRSDGGIIDIEDYKHVRIVGCRFWLSSSSLNYFLDFGGSTDMDTLDVHGNLFNIDKNATIDVIAITGGGSLDFTSSGVATYYDNTVVNENGSGSWRLASNPDRRFILSTLPASRNRYFASAAPTGGTFSAGDIVFYNAPTSGQKVGSVCVTGGSSGTWKEFGVIS